LKISTSKNLAGRGNRKWGLQADPSYFSWGGKSSTLTGFFIRSVWLVFRSGLGGGGGFSGKKTIRKRGRFPPTTRNDKARPKTMTKTHEESEMTSECAPSQGVGPENFKSEKRGKTCRQ